MNRSSIVPVAIVLLLLSPMAIFGAKASPPPKQVRASEIVDGDTIKVWWSVQKKETVRYLGINAAELSDVFGEDARKKNEALVGGRTVWLELQREEQGYTRDSRNRILAYVHLDKGAKRCVNVELVRLGAAKTDVRGMRDDTPPTDFGIKYLDAMIRAQIEASEAREGWWKQTDPYSASDLAVVFVKFWGNEEVAYLVNRGKTPIDLTDGWKLSNQGARASLVLSDACPMSPCFLPPGGTCIIHSGRFEKIPPPVSGNKEIHLAWKRQKVWRNSGDEARLLDRSGEVVYVYSYKNAKG